MIRRLLPVVGLFAALTLLVPRAQAQNTINIANFLPGSSPNFAFDSATGQLFSAIVGSGGGVTQGSVPVVFSFSVPNSYAAPFTSIAATFNFSALVGADTNPSPVDFTGAVTSLNFSITTGSSVLLAATASTGTLTINGGSGTTAGAVSAGDTVIFTSDFLDFSQSTARNFSLGFSAASPPVTGNGTPASFTATTTGTFASNNLTRVPEPSSLALIGLTLLPLARRKRRH